MRVFLCRDQSNCNLVGRLEAAPLIRTVDRLRNCHPGFQDGLPSADLAVISLQVNQCQASCADRPAGQLTGNVLHLNLSKS